MIQMILCVRIPSTDSNYVLASCVRYLPSLPLSSDQDLDRLTFVCFAMWDYLPIMLIIATITSPASGRYEVHANVARSRISRDTLAKLGSNIY